MSCRQLGGACDVQFKASTFEEIAEQSKEHGRQMFQQNDSDHIEAMQHMQTLMQSPEAMAEWFAEKKQLFSELPEID